MASPLQSPLGALAMAGAKALSRTAVRALTSNKVVVGHVAARMFELETDEEFDKASKAVRAEWTRRATNALLALAECI